MMGSLNLTDTIQILINGLIVMGLTAATTAAVFVLLFPARWGKQVRTVMQNRAMAGAVGIDTERLNRLTFGLGCCTTRQTEKAETVAAREFPSRRPWMISR